MSDTEQAGIERLLRSKPESIGELIDEMSVDLYEALKLAIEISKWPDGNRLEPRQRDFCMQAIILYEAKHLPEQDRIGFDLSASCKSKSQEQPLQRIDVAQAPNYQGNEGSKA